MRRQSTGTPTAPKARPGAFRWVFAEADRGEGPFARRSALFDDVRRTLRPRPSLPKHVDVALGRAEVVVPVEVLHGANAKVHVSTVGALRQEMGRK